MLRPNGIVDNAEVGVNRLFATFWSRRCATETMRAISQPISKGGRLLFAGDCWLDTQQNEAEWRQVAERDDNENSCDKDVMDVGSGWKHSWIISQGRCVTWIDSVWLHTDNLLLKMHPCPTLFFFSFHRPLLSPVSRTEAPTCPIKQLSFRSVWTCFKAFQVQTEFN